MIPLKQAHVLVGARTHPGMRGKNNEDRFAITAYQISKSDPRRALVAVVSDGVGGQQAGEVAAEITVEEISRYITTSDFSNPVTTLSQAVIEAHREIQEKAHTHKELSGMAATCVCAWIIEDRLYMAAVGDSRLYLIRNENIQQLTTDHTWIREAIDLGIVTLEEAPYHPNQHVIRRYLGSKNPMEPDIRLRTDSQISDQEAESNQGYLLQPGDILVLCTDGLTDLVEDAEIYSIFRNNDLENALDLLITRANSLGGHDNITIAAVAIPGNYQNIEKQPEQRNRFCVYLPLIIVGLVIVCIALFLLIFFGLQISNGIFGFGS